MTHKLVVVFCGPHNDDGSVSHTRIDRAIEEALQLNTLLLVAGDGNCGSDVRYFVERAKGAGVRKVMGLYDSGRCTLSDARVVVHTIKRLYDEEAVQVHLVTDWWHMSRSLIMLWGESNTAGIQLPRIKCVNVEGSTPPDHVLRGEAQGVTDYLSGTYGQRKAYPDWGKPDSSSHRIHA